MMDHDSEYYFLREADDERIPAVCADDDTSARNFSYEVDPIGTPLIFINSLKDEFLKKRKKEIIGPILFDGNNAIVNGVIRKALLRLDIPNLHLQPAVYIDIHDKWHEDYWYCTFIEKFDCWDREASNYEKDHPIELGGEVLYGIYRFNLNSKLLKEIPLSERLFFKMGGAIDAFITVHQSVLSIFSSQGTEGIRLQKLTEFGSA